MRSDDNDLVASSVCKSRPCLILLSGPRPEQAGQRKKKKKKEDAGAAAAVNFYVRKTGATWIKLYVKYFSRHDVAHALGIVCMKSRLKRSLSLEASACDRSDRRIRPPLRTVL